MTDVITLADKVGMAAVVVLILIFQVIPELRAIRRELAKLNEKLSR